MTYIQEASNQMVRLIKVIDSDPQISNATKRITSAYVDFLKAKGLSDRTISKLLYSLAVFYKTIGKANVSKLTKADVTKSISIVERSKYSLRTKADIKIAVKAMFKHISGEDEFYPPEVRWIKPALGSYKKILPEDVLTEEDILRIMDVITDVRDRAIASLLYDAGLRIGELLAMRVKDVDLSKDPAHVTVTGKTGMRQVPIFFSAPYLGEYLNVHKGKEPNSPLWLARGNWSNSGRQIDRAGVASLLKLAAKKAGIAKPVNPHAWRKASATRYANSLSDQQLKTFYGWTGSSRMPEVYVSLSGKNIDDAVSKANGIKVAEVEATTKLKPKMCPKCRYANETNALYCGRCGSALDISTALQQENDKQNLQELFNQFMQNREAVDRQLRMLKAKDREEATV